MDNRGLGGIEASEEDTKQAKQILSVIGGGYSIEDVLCVMRNHESSNLDDIVMTFFSDINMEEWRNKDKVFHNEGADNDNEVKGIIYPASMDEEEEKKYEQYSESHQPALTDSSLTNIFEDPITFETMVNAVTTPCGHSFSENSIKKWLSERESHCCPVCNAPLNIGGIVPNYSLRQAIAVISGLSLRSNSPIPLKSSGEKEKEKKREALKTSAEEDYFDDDDDLKDFVIVDRDCDNNDKNKKDVPINKNSNNSNNDKENAIDVKNIDENGDNKKLEKEIQEDDEGGEITLSNSSMMIPIIRDKINAVYSLDDNMDESVINDLHSDLLKYKKKLEAHIDHHIVFNTEADELTNLIDTFEEVDQIENNIIIKKKNEILLRKSGGVLLNQEEEKKNDQKHEDSNQIIEEEKKNEEPEEIRNSGGVNGDLTNSNFFLRISGKTEMDDGDMQYLQGPQKITKDDLYAAKKILSIVGGGKFTLDDVVLVMRHNHLLKPIEIIEVFLNGIDIEEYRRRDKDVLRLSAPMVECPLCFDEFPITDLFTLDCPETHRFCFECVQRMIDMNVNEGSLPYCPHQDVVNGQKKNCSYVISEREVSQIVYRSDLPPNDKRTLIEKYKKILLRIGLMSMKGCMGCPTPGCENWLVVDEDIDPMTGKQMKMQCPCSSCGKSFCSLCREIYHYHIDCEELRDVKIQWIQWNTQDRSGINKQLEDMAMQHRKADIAKRMEEFLADEKWKEDHLRLCPTCKNPIERVSGCDSMICGQNYHGGDVQRGCGAHFNWQTAEKYKSSFEREHLLSLNENLKIDKDDIDRIKADHGEFNICDVCNQRIIGFRFVCVNCPCYNLCENCEPVMDHNPSHILKIFVKPEAFEEEEIIIPEPPHPPAPPPVVVPPPPRSAVPLIQLPVTLNISNDHVTNWVPPPRSPKQSKLDKFRRWFGRNR